MSAEQGAENGLPRCTDTDCPRSGQACPYPNGGCPAGETESTKAVRRRVLASLANASTTQDRDFDEFATGSLVFAFDRLFPNLALRPRVDTEPHVTPPGSSTP